MLHLPHGAGRDGLAGQDSRGCGRPSRFVLFYDERAAATALLSGDSRKVMLPGRRIVAHAAGATRKNTAQVNTIQFRATAFTVV